MKNRMNQLILKTTAYSALLSNTISIFYASQPSTAIGKGIDNFFGKLFHEIANIYCGSLWILLWVINIVWLATTKNDKAVAILQKSIFIIPIVFVVLKVLVLKESIATNTLNTFTNWITN